MLRFLKIAIPVFIVGFVAGNAFWYLASPLWIDRVVSEPLPPGLMVRETHVGEFKGADAVHQGAGKARILAGEAGGAILRLTGFDVTNGPDLEVWLVADAAPADSAAVKASKTMSLGPLKGNKGDQTYVVPEGTDIAEWGSVVIWCRQFGVLFASAPLTASGA